MRRAPILAVVAALACPAAALATSRGVVLSLNSRHHTIQVVNAKHAVDAYRFRGRLRGVHPGSRITFSRSGRMISHVRATRMASRSVSFFGRVLRSSAHHLSVRLADGKTLTFGARQLANGRGAAHSQLAHIASAAPAGVTVNILGLEPGVTVLITETVDGAGNLTITITLPPPTAVGGEQQANGFLTDLESDTFTLQTPDGSELRLHMAQDQLANLGLQPCDTIAVTYHQDAGLLIADTVQKTGTTSSGDCGDGGDSGDVVGTITQVSSTSLTIATQDQGPMTFAVDSPDVTDGFQPGDVVDVVYSGSGGTLDAVDVEYMEEESSGTVTSVSAGVLTITDGASGQPETFTADPTSGTFDGISVGDDVDVAYHQSSGQLVADFVDDQTSWGDY